MITDCPALEYLTGFPVKFDFDKVFQWAYYNDTVFNSLKHQSLHLRLNELDMYKFIVCNLLYERQQLLKVLVKEAQNRPAIVTIDPELYTQAMKEKREGA